ncbi:uncharacterized protein NPIL_339501 [Nephila pilipes]|uniref:Uncharacterized protein n=1 Tax=Nephila pilipes TaxID=299642 RepID=A0A8X6PBV2_NEPPI|nr:uncharacterized protein NPIL_339501 [Nephila pilipes]
MAWCSFPIIPLRQMAMGKIAIAVCNDPEIQDFVKEHGSVSFVFPSKETHVYLEKVGRQFEQTCELDPQQTWAWKNVLLDGNFWNVIDNMNEGENLFDSWKMTEGILPFQRWEELVDKKISSFLLPPLLRSELLDVIRSIAAEIDKWIKDHTIITKNVLEIARTCQCYFQWNSFWKIDRLKTVYKLLEKEILDTKDLEYLAYHYGFLDIILLVRSNDLRQGKVPKSADACNLEVSIPFDDRAFIVWKTLIGNSDFDHHAQVIFFLKSKSQQNFESLHSVMKRESLQFHLFLFFLSRMGDDKKEEIFKTYPLKVLLYFLDWPFQGQFLEAAKHLLPYFKENDFRDILIVILYERIAFDRKDFNYNRLLKEFWSMSPDILKQFIKTHSIYASLMYTLNYPNCETFPSQQFLEKYQNNCLTFGYRGMKYFLIRIEAPISYSKMISIDIYNIYRQYRFGNLFYVCKVQRK